VITVDALRARAGPFVLHDVSFSLPRGAWGIVLGTAGAGKTTLLETIAGVRDAESGRIVLRGDDVTRLPPEHRGVGIVYQHAFLFPHLSVRDNVRYGAADAAHALALATRFGAGPLLDRDVRDLSGGERQMVALARALAPRPDILLLDEPFAAVDPITTEDIRRNIRELADSGIGILITDHNVRETLGVTDRAYIMADGRIFRSGAPLELTEDPEVRRLYLGEKFRM
jgi:ABC-type lipopolysaccharide export system ATPase subunit